MTRILVTAAVSLLPTLGLTAPAVAVEATSYVALGDSYSSGTGAGSYGNSGDCKRSANSYPQLWANSHAPSQFQFVACLGARTSDVLNNQVSALNAGTTLVTVSIGGNDAGFTDVMIDCTLGSDQNCVNRVNTAKDYVNGTLPGLLDNVYATMKQKAPNAVIIVLGYPRLFELAGSCRAGLGDTKRAAINSGADTLAEVTASRVAAAGLRFVDMRGPFTGHGICSGDWWLHSLSWPVDESYHPNQAGQRFGYLVALEAVTGVPASVTLPLLDS